jgi:glycosyltransferase involved in cell wall biosynthesis
LSSAGAAPTEAKEPDTLHYMSTGETPLVHFRTPTFRRPGILLRALTSMQAQTVSNWICDVYDDDPEGSARTLVEDLADSRVRYTHNKPQRRAAGNIDRSFTRNNPYGARWFAVIEDDNYILPTYIEENVALAEAQGVNILLRNQFIEMRGGTPDAWLTDAGIQDRKFREGVYSPETFRLSVLVDIGVSNGGLFWSRNLSSDLEVKFPCDPALQEYVRTLAIAEPIYVAMKPLAVWAKQDERTGRNIGDRRTFLRRELDLKRSIQRLRQEVWERASPDARAGYLENKDLLQEPAAKAELLVKSLIKLRVAGALDPIKTTRLIMRGLMIRVLGNTSPELTSFLSERWPQPYYQHNDAEGAPRQGALP